VKRKRKIYKRVFFKRSMNVITPEEQRSRREERVTNGLSRFYDSFKNACKTLEDSNHEVQVDSRRFARAGIFYHKSGGEFLEFGGLINDDGKITPAIIHHSRPKADRLVEVPTSDKFLDELRKSSKEHDVYDCLSTDKRPYKFDETMRWLNQVQHFRE